MRSSAALDSNAFVSLHQSLFHYGSADLGLYYSVNRDLQGRARIPGQSEGQLQHVCSRPIEKIPHTSRGDVMDPLDISAASGAAQVDQRHNDIYYPAPDLVGIRGAYLLVIEALAISSINKSYACYYHFTSLNNP